LEARPRTREAAGLGEEIPRLEARLSQPGVTGFNHHPMKTPAATRRHTLGLLAGLAGASLLPLGVFAQAGFDHQYTAWNALLKKHVRWLSDGKQSRVNYKGFAAERAGLKGVLDGLSAVPKAAFDGWSRPQQMAFLINAYNAFTVEIILTKYPDLKSIKEFGFFNCGPWKNEFFTLLGDKRHLDWVEHEQLRPVYKDPRIHSGVNCASIGCPALRDEAFTADKLDAQFDDGLKRFMGDRTRNRVKGGEVQVNKIFKWFKEDFNSGYRGINKLEDLLAQHAEQLSDKPDEQAALRAKSLPVAYLDYDWSLNDLGR
jgi:hypothetical protein